MKSNLIQKILRLYFIIVGYFKCKKFVVGETYFGGIHNAHMVYRGDKIFYETRNFDAGNGFQFIKGDAVKYTLAMIGMCKFRKWIT